MDQQDILLKLRELIRQLLGVKLEDVKPESVLVKDLGAESIDLLDLSFLIEDTFHIHIEPNEFEKEVKERIPDRSYEREGYLTEDALLQLRAALPEVDQSRLVQGLRKAEIPSLLTVSVFVRLVERKLQDATGVDEEVS